MSNKRDTKIHDFLQKTLKGNPQSIDQIVKEGAKEGLIDSSIRGRIYNSKDQYINIVDKVYILPEDLRNKPLPNDIVDKIILNNKQTTNTKVRQHSVVQSILIIIGKYLGFVTYIPSQDKKYPYKENHLLGTIADTYTLPNIFTKDEMQSLRTIDVIWLTECNNITSVFEVQNNDREKMKKKLDNFLSIEKICTNMYIISDINETTFKEIIEDSKYTSIKSKVLLISQTDIISFYKVWDLYLNVLQDYKSYTLLSQKS